MTWVVFSYSISRPSRSSPRVALWRRLQRVGAVSPLNGIYVLPGRPECLEAFQWLAQEIRAAEGQALVMQVDHFQGITDADLSALFNQARAEEYRQLEGMVEGLAKLKDPLELQEEMRKIRRRHAEILRVDYFNSPEGMRVAQRLSQLAERLLPRSETLAFPTARLNDYRGKTWVTRPQPYVDRLACAWLIRRFIDPKAAIRYSLAPKPHEIAFDMEEGSEFGHAGNLCTFETMQRAFGLNDPGLDAVAEIVHEIDLNDGRYARPAASGVDSVLAGWHRAQFSDAELEARGISLFEGLYLHFSHTPTEQIKKRVRGVGGKVKGRKR